MIQPSVENLGRLVKLAEDNDSEIILSNLSEFALDGNSAHAEAVLMAEAAVLIWSALTELRQCRQQLAEAPHDWLCDSEECRCWKAEL